MPHILSVADIDMTQERTHRLLAGAGYRVTTASSAAEALARYVAQRPDGVLIEVEGLAVKPVPILRALRQVDPQARIAIVHPGDADDAQALAEESEASQLLMKPFDPTRWLRTVEALVNPRGSRHYVRVRTTLQAQIAPGNIHAALARCMIEDITPEGARCRLLDGALPAGFQPGGVIHLSFDLPQSAVHAIARIVHVADQTTIGAFFLRLSPEAHARLGQYYEAQLRQQDTSWQGTPADRRLA